MLSGPTGALYVCTIPGRLVRIQSSETPNLAPTASFTVTPELGPAPLTVNVDASSSSDADGSIESYFWNFGDEFSDSGITQSHTFREPGNYTISLTVTDNLGAFSVIERDVSVRERENQPPSSLIESAVPVSGPAPLTVTFIGRGSDESDIVLHSWDFDDGSSPVTFSDPGNGMNSTITHTFLDSGIYEVMLLVIDDGGLTATHSVSIEVTENNDTTLLLSADFDTDEDGFIYSDDAFRNTAEPDFADGIRIPSGGFSGGALQILLGNTDDADILGMSGGWERSFSLESPQPVTVTFRYKLTQASNYEADEFSQALLAVDGSVVMTNGNSFLAQITGDGNGGADQTTDWVPISTGLGILSAGSHTINFGVFNNKKTFNDESTELLIDNITVEGKSDNSIPDPVLIIENHFDSGADGFVFEKDTFRQTSAPEYSNGAHLPDGGFSGGGLQVLLGNLDNEDILGISGGWSQSFILESSQQVTASFRFNLSQNSDYESDEFSEVLVMVDETLIGPYANGSLIRLTGDGNGGPDQSTGWILVTLDLGILTAGEVHTLTIGGFNNKKTVNNELTDLRIDDVIVSGESVSLPDTIFESNFDSDEEEFFYEDDAFFGTRQPEFASGRRTGNDGVTGGGLELVLGNINNEDILGISGGWSRSFVLNSPRPVTLSFRYNLTQAANFENDEFCVALVALDDKLIAPGAADALVRLTGDGNGGGDQTTGWVLVNLDLGTLDGEHTITIGAFNNKKTFNDEFTKLLIDDVSLR